MAIRRWWAWATIGVLLTAPFVGCSDDDDEGTPPAAGSAGAAGTDAAAGSAGSAGQIITAGSGGSAGEDAALDGGGTCSIKNLDFGQQCMTCGKKLCCDELSACDSDPACVSLATCVAACPLDDAGAIQNDCIQACASQQDVISAAYTPMVFCLGNTDPDAAESCGLPCPF